MTGRGALHRRMGMAVHRTVGLWELYVRTVAVHGDGFMWVRKDWGTEAEVRRAAADMGLVSDLYGPLRHAVTRDRLGGRADAIGAFGFEDRRLSS